MGDMVKNLFGDDVPEPGSLCGGRPGSLRDRFIEPPFSILQTSGGNWQMRKKMWRNLGIESEVGRGEGLAYGNHLKYDLYRQAKTDNTKGTSIFDPVLCELLYRWFCPPGGDILDPFAGGSVRGIVACHQGYRYTGIDLSEKQVASNEEQAALILKDGSKPSWYVGDSAEVLGLAPGEEVKYEDQYDFIFTCPPYHDLEVYSSDPRDLSAVDWAAFILKYQMIITESLRWLRNERFAVYVTGDIRDKTTGFYKPLGCVTTKAHMSAGAHLYNHIILATVVGSASLRATRQFSAMRKVVKVHQDVLVFYKGRDPRTVKGLFPDAKEE